jgi:hypothetical protein
MGEKQAFTTGSVRVNVKSVAWETCAKPERVSVVCLQSKFRCKPPEVSVVRLLF